VKRKTKHKPRMNADKMLLAMRLPSIPEGAEFERFNPKTMANVPIHQAHGHPIGPRNSETSPQTIPNISDDNAQ
jgi:hypothetical protein